MEKWINESVILDFHIPRDISDFMKRCDALAAGEDVAYFNYVEYLGSKIYEILGFPVHKTMLGVRNGKLVVL